MGKQRVESGALIEKQPAPRIFMLLGNLKDEVVLLEQAS